MSNAVFWGLTNKDFENVLWNGVTYLAVGYAGKAVGAIVTLASEKFLFPNDKSATFMQLSNSKILGIVVGTFASVSLAQRLPFITLTGQTALKSLVIGLVTGAVGNFASNQIGILGPVPSRLGILPFVSGMFGYFGPWILYLPAIGGSIDGSFLARDYYNEPSSFL
jgi:hypothetical protein